jgi:hypothetical protein
VLYHNRLSSRAVATLQEWYDYQEALCDYCSKSTDGDGVVTYTTHDISETYRVDDSGRPIEPTDND